MREYNLDSNRKTGSKDIANRFASIEHLRFLCSGGVLSSDVDSRDR